MARDTTRRVPRSDSSRNEYAQTGSQTVERALRLFDYVCRSAHPVTLGEAAKWAQLSKPTTFRMLQTLTNCGLLQQKDDTRSYSPGLRLFELYNLAVHHLDPLLEARPELVKLSTMYNETVHMAVLDEGDVVYIAKEESNRAVRMFSAIGKRAPSYCTGVGKALLAFATDEEVAKVLRRGDFVRYTPATITTVPELMTELQAIRDRSYSIDNGEHEAEIRCIASPIYNADGQLIAAISLTMPTPRFETKSVSELAENVISTARRISRRLGCYGKT